MCALKNKNKAAVEHYNNKEINLMANYRNLEFKPIMFTLKLIVY